jgi:hypothetical protein
MIAERRIESLKQLAGKVSRERHEPEKQNRENRIIAIKADEWPVSAVRLEARRNSALLPATNRIGNLRFPEPRL